MCPVSHTSMHVHSIIQSFDIMFLLNHLALMACMDIMWCDLMSFISNYRMSCLLISCIIVSSAYRMMSSGMLFLSLYAHILGKRQSLSITSSPSSAAASHHDISRHPQSSNQLRLLFMCIVHCAAPAPLLTHHFLHPPASI